MPRLLVGWAVGAMRQPRGSPGVSARNGATDRAATVPRAMSDQELEWVPPRRRLWVAVAGAVVIVALLAASVAAAWTSIDESDRDPLSSPSDGSGEGGSDDEDTSPTESLPPASESDLRAAVDEISAVVERERGLTFTEPVVVELAGEGDFQRRLLEDFDEGVDELRQTEVLLKAFGLVELDLDRPEYDDADDEIGFGFGAVVEGNARRVEEAYRATLSDEEQLDAAAEELALGTGLDLGDVPPVLVELISAPYGLGERFVDELIDEGGQPALDAAFDSPPRTSEQVIDPAAYRAGEAGAELPVPSGPGGGVDDGVAGPFLIQIVLAGELGDDQARAAAQGWGGDRVVAWRDGERSCVTL